MDVFWSRANPSERRKSVQIVHVLFRYDSRETVAFQSYEAEYPRVLDDIDDSMALSIFFTIDSSDPVSSAERPNLV